MEGNGFIDGIREDIWNFIKKKSEDFYDGYKLEIVNFSNYLGCDVYMAEAGDGLISKIENENGKWGIYINEIHHPNRRRFAVANGIGHYISWRHKSYSYHELEKNRSIENEEGVFFRKNRDFFDADTEANRIAAELLMPKEFVEKTIKKNFSIEEMAARFFVSPISMTIRLKNLMRLDPQLFDSYPLDNMIF